MLAADRFTMTMRQCGLTSTEQYVSKVCSWFWFRQLDIYQEEQTHPSVNIPADYGQIQQTATYEFVIRNWQLILAVFVCLPILLSAVERRNDWWAINQNECWIRGSGLVWGTVCACVKENHGESSQAVHAVFRSTLWPACDKNSSFRSKTKELNLKRELTLMEIRM
jgi:hypothetical protein